MPVCCGAACEIRSSARVGRHDGPDGLPIAVVGRRFPRAAAACRILEGAKPAEPGGCELHSACQMGCKALHCRDRYSKPSGTNWPKTRSSGRYRCLRCRAALGRERQFAAGPNTRHWWPKPSRRMSGIGHHRDLTVTATMHRSQLGVGRAFGRRVTQAQRGVWQGRRAKFWT